MTLDTARTAADSVADHLADHNTLHGKSNAWIDAVADFGMDAAAVDNSTALQAAIDEASAFPQVDVGVVKVPPGTYHFTDVIDWKNCSILGTWPNSSMRFVWDGASGATFMTKTLSASFGELAGINFRNGVNPAGKWIDFVGEEVDKFLHLHHLMFQLPTITAIDVGIWYNAHWDHFRWDGNTDSAAGWAMRFTPPVGQALSSFHLNNFTYDHRATSPASDGMIRVDNTAGASTLGVFKLENGRIEVNRPWANDQAIVSYAVGSTPRSLGLHLSDVTAQETTAGLMANECVLFRDTANTSASETLILTNFRSNFDQMLGGTWPAGYPMPRGGSWGSFNLSNDPVYGEAFSNPHLLFSDAATGLGNVVAAQEVFAPDGTSLGFIPIYDTIT